VPKTKGINSSKKCPSTCEIFSFHKRRFSDEQCFLSSADVCHLKVREFAQHVIFVYYKTKLNNLFSCINPAQLNFSGEKQRKEKAGIEKIVDKGCNRMGDEERVGRRRSG
jgi:hypothetical protein